MKDSKVEQLLSQAKQGDDMAREKLIRRYKPYIIHTVGQINKRYTNWSDEEASIGLLAFNKAIDTFDPHAGRSFLNYVYLLIKRDLIDYFKKEKREQHLTLQSSAEEMSATTTDLESDISLDSYHKTVRASELVEEILELDQSLKKFGIRFEELEQVAPKHKKTRLALLNIVQEFVQHKELVDHFLIKKRVPTTAFVQKTGFPIKTIERFRTYFITLIILALHPEWTQLSTFIDFPREKRDHNE